MLWNTKPKLRNIEYTFHKFKTSKTWIHPKQISNIVSIFQRIILILKTIKADEALEVFLWDSSYVWKYDREPYVTSIR